MRPVNRACPQITSVGLQLLRITALRKASLDPNAALFEGNPEA